MRYPNTPRVQQALDTDIFSWTIIPDLIEESTDPAEQAALHEIMVNRYRNEENQL